MEGSAVFLCLYDSRRVHIVKCLPCQTSGPQPTPSPARQGLLLSERDSSPMTWILSASNPGAEAPGSKNKGLRPRRKHITALEPLPPDVFLSGLSSAELTKTRALPRSIPLKPKRPPGSSQAPHSLSAAALLPTTPSPFLSLVVQPPLAAQVPNFPCDSSCAIVTQI
jgi:hypothetical protein